MVEGEEHRVDERCPAAGSGNARQQETAEVELFQCRGQNAVEQEAESGSPEQRRVRVVADIDRKRGRLRITSRWGSLTSGKNLNTNNASECVLVSR